jgi:hypothetical protein
MKSVTIQAVTDKFRMEQFIKVPWMIYKDDPYWVPPLLYDFRRQLSQKRNPFFKDASVCYWIAVSERRCIGRIAAIVNHLHNKHYNEKTGFIGYFESINNENVSRQLFQAAENWLSSQGMTEVRGPVNLSMNNECGLLVEGFEMSPIIQMNYNPAYYVDLFLNQGYRKQHDLLAFYVKDEIIQNKNIMSRLERFTNLLAGRENISFRCFNKNDFDGEVERIRHLFNNYMCDNWGYVPIEKEEFTFMATSLKPLLIRELAIFAEVGGEAVGFSLAIPDVNEVFKKINGKLFPKGIFQFFYYKRKIKDIRVILMGINKPYRKKGLEAVFYYRTIIEAVKRKFKGAELSWVSESNQPMIRELIKMEAKPYKRYRIFKNEIKNQKQVNHASQILT